MTRWLVVALLLVATVADAGGRGGGNRAADRFRSYDYVRERTNHNDAPEIDMFLDYCGVPRRNPWCAASAVYVWGKPVPRIARVSSLLDYCRRQEGTFTVYGQRDLTSGRYVPRRGDLMIWLYGKGKNPNGHIGLVYEDGSPWGKIKTIEGNTVPDDTGNQRGEGGQSDPINGVYYRWRKAQTAAAFVRVKEW